MASSIDHAAALADLRMSLRAEKDRADRATAEAKSNQELWNKQLQETTRAQVETAAVRRAVAYEKEVADNLRRNQAYREAELKEQVAVAEDSAKLYARLLDEARRKIAELERQLPA
ncbi:MAG: hypothetical protein Hyperionvirus39_4 [Hyperionvirus sp.]|uniref:Uncharacterized protein n=1 Tax=Hyperionvirus sp. TaxID=2487770 RepID=A0A3G5ADU0_9VIRU|nr:MAG: hypothetical protein Hyperionvirus39_4 [Hyperionvirus sp.]